MINNFEDREILVMGGDFNLVLDTKVDRLDSDFYFLAIIEVSLWSRNS